MSIPMLHATGEPGNSLVYYCAKWQGWGVSLPEIPDEPWKMSPEAGRLVRTVDFFNDGREPLPGEQVLAEDEYAFMLAELGHKKKKWGGLSHTLFKGAVVQQRSPWYVPVKRFSFQIAFGGERDTGHPVPRDEPILEVEGTGFPPLPRGAVRIPHTWEPWQLVNYDAYWR